jgi:hypothetical protein
VGCPKCGVDNFEFPGPCLQCGFQGEAKLFQEWLNLNFLLKELAGWGHLPEFYRGRLRDRYGRQRRDVEIRLGLRQAPLDTEAAEAARRELSGLRAFTISDLTRWVERGWLTPDVAGRLREDCNNRITALQERLVDAPPRPRSLHHLTRPGLYSSIINCGW